MDYKIKVGLLCVVTLFMACSNVVAGSNDTTTDISTVVSTGSTKSVPTKSGGGAGSTQTTTTTKAQTPVTIKCYTGTCNGTCDNLDQANYCNTTIGCKIVTNEKGDHTFSCFNTGTCADDPKTNTTCCKTDYCKLANKTQNNPDSGASTVIGSLISISLMMLFISFL
ncbi:hypothetical protein ACF0H5_000985 [Mactra antiquata]